MSQTSITDMLDNSPGTPNTRKRQRNYADLNKYGFEGPLSSPTTSIAKKPRKKYLEVKEREPPLSQLSNLDSEITPFESMSQVSNTIQDSQKSKKHSWLWQYYTTTILSDQVYKKGKKKELAPDELYVCNVNPKCQFKRQASKLSGTTTPLSDHLETKHNIFKTIDPKSARSGKPTVLQQ